MKKILSITCLAILMFSGKMYSQSNITWKVKDNIQKGYFKSRTTFDVSFDGFTSKTESDKFFEKLKSNPEVISAVLSNVDAKGNGDVKLTMKQPHDKMYYVGLAQKLGIAYFEVNGTKKTPSQIMMEKREGK